MLQVVFALLGMEGIGFPEFEQAQVGVLVVDIVGNGFQPSEQQGLTHGIQVSAQRVEQHHAVFRLIRFQFFEIGSFRQRIVHHLVETVGCQ